MSFIKIFNKLMDFGITLDNDVLNVFWLKAQPERSCFFFGFIFYFITSVLLYGVCEYAICI